MKLVYTLALLTLLFAVPHVAFASLSVGLENFDQQVVNDSGVLYAEKFDCSCSKFAKTGSIVDGSPILPVGAGKAVNLNPAATGKATN